MYEASGTWSEAEIEKRVQERGLNAPRISPEDIDKAIDESVPVQYYTFPGTTVTVCCVTMRNGACVVGKSAAVSRANFDERIGKEVALKDARQQMWPLLGYALLERLAVKK